MLDHLGDVYQQPDAHARRRAPPGERAVELYDQNRRRKSDERYRELREAADGDCVVAAVTGPSPTRLLLFRVRRFNRRSGLHQPARNRKRSPTTRQSSEHI